MYPDELDRMLGSDHNVPWARLREICEAFNREAREIAKETIEKHESRCHDQRARFPEPIIGSELWVLLHKN